VSVMASFLDQMIRAFGPDANLMVFQERESEILVKGREFLADNVWRRLNEMVREEFGGRYSPAEKGWVIPKPKPVSEEEPTRTGIPKLDEKLEEIERDKEPMRGIDPYTGLPVDDEKAAEREAAEEVLSEDILPPTAAELIAGKIRLVEVDDIQPNQYNPNEMSEEEFKALVENMKQEGPHGTSPIEVRLIKGSDY
jgi:hypothetical protein